MSLYYPVKKVYITQPWGVNQHIYQRFGLLGHNGQDYRAFLPDGSRCYEGGKSEIFSPHDGVVIENWFDADGYGWIVKIENEKEGSILAHMSDQSSLKVGESVKAGDFVGYQGSTGFSTAIHLHWGYYPKPRNKANGYSGTIDQEKLSPKQLSELTQPVKDNMNEMPEALKKYGKGTITDLVKWIDDEQNLLNGDREKITRLEGQIVELGKEVDKAFNKGFQEGLDIEKPIEIKKEMTVVGLNWEVSGLHIDSEGKITADYQIIK